MFLDTFDTVLLPYRRRAIGVSLELAKIVTNIGPRLAGKTYYLYQVIWDLPENLGIAKHQMHYQNFEDECLDREGDDVSRFAVHGVAFRAKYDSLAKIVSTLQRRNLRVYRQGWFSDGGCGRLVS